jgi:hypothetical protein
MTPYDKKEDIRKCCSSIKVVNFGLLCVGLVVLICALSFGGEKMEKTIQHSKFPVVVTLPAGWSAIEVWDSIMLIDRWNLLPPDYSQEKWFMVSLIITRLPRSGRQSAFFPGAISEDRKYIEIKVADKSVRAALEGRRPGNYVVFADEERDGLFVGVKALYSSEEEKRIVFRLIENMKI